LKSDVRPESRFCISGTAPVGWSLCHATLFALLIVATFIDFDERTVPDWITVSGTCFALAMAGAAPHIRLPEVRPGLAGLEVTAVAYWSPAEPEVWHRGGLGLALVIGVLAVSTFALLPKITTLRWGLVRGVRLMWASLIRPPRRVSCAIRIRQRRPFAMTYWLGAIGTLLAVLAIAVWGSSSESRWDAVFDAVVGLAVGGGLVWAVRWIAGVVLGVEAMGFGDVTLMGMIGAHLGWQASLLVFALAPFAAVVIAVSQYIASRNKEIAFGPYLALAAVAVVVFWYALWNQWAATAVFSLGGRFLLGALVAGLGLLAVMLGAIRWSRRATG
jgi:prepilin signal peptidase PulO-like enzyme (type II secretory pathway)